MLTDQLQQLRGHRADRGEEDLPVRVAPDQQPGRLGAGLRGRVIGAEPMHRPAIEQWPGQGGALQRRVHRVQAGRGRQGGRIPLVEGRFHPLVMGQFGQCRMRQRGLVLQPLHELGGQFGEQRGLRRVHCKEAPDERRPRCLAKQAHADRKAVAKQPEHVVEHQPLVDAQPACIQPFGRGNLGRIAQVRGEGSLLRVQTRGGVSHAGLRHERPSAGGWCAARHAVRHTGGN